MRRLAVLALLALPALAAPAPRPYHLTLEATPAAAFPFLSKFGTVTLHLYSGGVRAETFWLNGFSRNESPNITVENPDSSPWMVYFPGRRFCSRYSPFSLVTAD